MIAWILIACSLLVCAAFIGGIFVGAKLTRVLREVVIKEVAKVVETQKVVVQEKPIVVQVPVYKKPEGGGLVAMGQPGKHTIADPVEREQFEHTKNLLDNLGGPE